MAVFKRVRTLEQWRNHFEGSEFNFLHSQGLCIITTTHEDGTVTTDGHLNRVMNQETREVKWMLMRPRNSSRISRFMA